LNTASRLYFPLKKLRSNPRGAVGLWVENSRLAYPVQEITFAGTLLKMLKGVTMVGNDLSFKLGSVALPTFLFSEATIGEA
jgi:PmbA protein